MKTSQKFWSLVLTGLGITIMATEVNAGGLGGSRISGASRPAPIATPTAKKKVPVAGTLLGTSPVISKLPVNSTPVSTINPTNPVNPVIGKINGKPINGVLKGLGGTSGASGASGAAGSGSSASGSGSSSSSSSSSSQQFQQFLVVEHVDRDQHRGGGSCGGSASCDGGCDSGVAASADSTPVANPTPVTMVTVRIVNPADTAVDPDV